MIKFIFYFYLKMILIFFFIPVSIIVNCFNIRKQKFSNFVKSDNKKYYKIFNLKFYSVLSFFIFIFLCPFLRVLRFSNLHFFKSKKINIKQTPKQVASLVAYRVINNLRLINKVSEINKNKYIFILQPLLLAGGISTDIDKKLAEYIANQKYDGFSYDVYCKEYYNFIKKSILQDKELQNKFIDFSKIFSEIKEQRFVDPVHFGNIGQLECAKLISQTIIENEKKLK